MIAYSFHISLVFSCKKVKKSFPCDVILCCPSSPNCNRCTAGDFLSKGGRVFHCDVICLSSSLTHLPPTPVRALPALKFCVPQNFKMGFHRYVSECTILVPVYFNLKFIQLFYNAMTIKFRLNLCTIH